MKEPMEDVHCVGSSLILMVPGMLTILCLSLSQGEQKFLSCKPLVQLAICKKGKRTMGTTFKTFIPATEREGIPGSIQMIVDRHRAGEKATSIVAPPRYGKSDIIRLSSMELVQTGLASAALALVPWDNLADQLVEKDKTIPMTQRYMNQRLPSMPDLFVAGRIKTISDSFHETSTLQHLFTATIQLVNNQRVPFFQNWLSRCMFYGERPVVFIDEGQLLSNSNEWGAIAQDVIDAGAHVVLLTGTPYRADSKPIPGFRVKVLSQENIERRISKRINDKQIKKTTYEGTKAEQILEANYEVTLKQAWEIKALCKVDTKWIDSKLDIDGETKSLSEIKGCDATKHLRSVVTNKKTIDAAMQKAIEDMHDRRRAGMSDSAIIVVTASDINGDDASDGEVNYHARMVKKRIKRIDPSLDVMIATQADDRAESKQKEGKKNLKKFSNGSGDVLIVKNMGTVGLDCPRIKTVVLLGTTRQLATWTQTILRGATTWGNVAYFTLILTDDEKNKNNWNFIVHGQGGEVSSLSKLEKVHEEIINKDKEDDPPTNVTVIDSKYVRTEDSHSQISLFDETDVHAVIAHNPILRERMSTVEIWNLIQSGIINVPKEREATVGVVDTGSECESLRQQITDLAKDYANSKANYGLDRQSWVDARKDFYTQAKQCAGIRKPIEKETDPAVLRVVLSYCEKMVGACND